MEAAAILGIALFCLYTGICISQFGIPKSLSDTYYLLGGEKSIGYAFSITLYATAMLMIAYWFTITEEQWQFLVFLSAGGLVLVGAAPLFKGRDSGWHTAFALICAACAIAWTIATGHAWYLVVATLLIAGAGAVTRTLKDCRIFWLEMIAFGTIFSSLIGEVVR